MPFAAVRRSALSAYTRLEGLFRLRRAFARRPVRLGCEGLEVRVVPDGYPTSLPATYTPGLVAPPPPPVPFPNRPVPLPMIFAGSGPGVSASVAAYDIDTGTLAFTLAPYEPGFLGGVRSATADFNLDKIPDVVVGPGPGGGPRVRVFDGVTGLPLAGTLGGFFAYSPDFTGGVNVAAGDVDGDGVPDVITAAGPGGGPHVRVFSGKTGNEVASFFAYGPDFAGGVSVAAADLNADLRAEILVGAGPGGGPRVRAFDLSGESGPVELDRSVGNFFAYEPAFTGGVWVAAGDVNGDMLPDVVVGPGEGRAAEVRVFDGVSGAKISSFAAFDATVTGGVRVGTAYVDDDANADVAVGTGPGVASRVRFYSAGTGNLVTGPLADFAPFGSESLGGVFVGTANDPGTEPTTFADLVVEGVASGGTYLSGRRFTVTAELTDARTTPTTPPTGTVTFFANVGKSVYPLGAAGLSAIGGTSSAATFTAEDIVLPVGSVTISATYSGDDTFAAAATSSTPPNRGKTLTVMKEGPTSQPCECDTCGTPPDAPANGRGAGVAPPVQRGAGGVRLSDGTVRLAINDLGGTTGDRPWANGRGWTNAGGFLGGVDTDPGFSIPANYNGDPGFSIPGDYDGDPGFTPRASRLARVGPDSLYLATGVDCGIYFDPVGGVLRPRYGETTTLAHNVGTHEYTTTDGTGARAAYHDFDSSVAVGLRGKLKWYADAGGAVTEVTATDADGRPLEFTRVEGTGSTAITEQFVYAYVASGDSEGRVESATLRRKVGSGAWGTVRSVEYTYYAASDDHGGPRDLKFAVVKDATGTTIDTSYYRYYTDNTSIGYTRGLKTAFGPSAYSRLVGSLGTGVDALSDSAVTPFADHYLEYDSAKRVTTHVAAGEGCSACTGGQGAYTYEYTDRGSGLARANEWSRKVVETRPDGNATTYYLNSLGQVMLDVQDGGAGDDLRTYRRYDTSGRAVLTAMPSAVTGYSEGYADLVNDQGGNFQYLADDSGFVATVDYAEVTTATSSAAGDAAGFVTGTAIRRGELGTPVPQSASAYIERTVGGVDLYFPASSTSFTNDDGTGAETTTAAYTWQGSTARPAAVTTTMPVVTAAQNGSGVAVSTTAVYDAAGRTVWSKDGGGFLAYTQYDPATGGVLKRISDVDTTQTSTFAGLPSGWTTPTGGGLHLTSTFEIDEWGRTTKATSPGGRVDYTVFKDALHETRYYPAWDSTTNTPTGPTTVSRDDRLRNYAETLTMSATPAVSGGRPTGAESITSLESLSRTVRNDAGQAVYSDAYFDLTGLTYSATSVTLGTSGTNFYRSTTGYGKLGQVNKTVTPAGTITRTEIDEFGRTVSEWVGTDDVPDAGFWAVDNLSGTDMTKVRESEYDDGGVGDGNVTKVIEYGVTSLGTVTRTWFDWRNRPVIVKQGVQSSEDSGVNRPVMVTDYDNLGRAVRARTYDGDSITPEIRDGVVHPLSDSLLRAQSTTAFDAWGRALRTTTDAVDPATGAVGSHGLHAWTWYDSRGQVVKTLSPGGLVQKTQYDGVGRVTAAYTTDGGGQRASDFTAASFGRLFGDIDGSGGVTFDPDYTAFDATFGLTSTDDGFEPAFDSDANGTIAFSDYTQFNSRYGKSLAGTPASVDGGVSFAVNGGAAQRSRVTAVTIDLGPGVTVAAGAFSLSGVGIDGTTTLTAPTVTQSVVVGGRTVVTLTFSGTGVVGGSLPDGTWAVTADRTKIAGDIGLADALTTTGDTVLSQVEYAYDADGNTLTTTSRDRFHDATGTGPLGTPTTGVPARVSYSGMWYDEADRPIASADVGTNGGTAWTRPGTVPTRSDTVLVTSTAYDVAGRPFETTDPMGRVRRTTFDDLGRTTKTVENYVDGTPSDADDKTTEYAYGPAGMTSLTAKLTGGGQTTQWVYGVSPAAGSGVTSNDVVGATRWPDATTGAASSSEEDTVTVDALGRTTSRTDRNGTTHEYEYDAVGRVTADIVTTLGADLDGTVLRVGTEYDGQGNIFRVTSLDKPDNGSVVNQVEREYNGFGQLVAEYQAVAGAVNTSTTPKVEYAYSEAAGGANHSRPISLSYPGGWVLNYAYGSAGSLADRISRLDAMTHGSTTLEGYTYLGLGTVVTRSHPEPGVDLTYVKRSTESVGDAGDQYTGLDRFGRVVDQRWLDPTTGTATDRYQYGHDRNGNRVYEDNLVDTSLSELYTYDGLDQLASFARGTLNSTKTGITGTPARTQAWDFDAAGNFDAVTTDGVAESRTANAQNEITSIGSLTTPGYDAAGNMIQDEQDRIGTYDAWNRLKAMGSAQYAYDGLGRRITESAEEESRTLYYSAGWQVLEERTAGGAVAERYVWSPVYVDALLLRDRDTDANGVPDERLYAQHDANWNITALLGPDGLVKERMTFDPYGRHEVRDAAWAVATGTAYDWRYLHQGGRFHNDAGLYHFRHRDYSPTLSFWITVDPLGFLSDSLNFYSFVNSNPIIYTDPQGLSGKSSENPEAQKDEDAFKAAAKKCGTTDAQLNAIMGIMDKIPMKRKSLFGNHQKCWEWVDKYDTKLKAQLNELNGTGGPRLDGITFRKIVIYKIPYGSTGNTNKDVSITKWLVPSFIDLLNSSSGPGMHSTGGLGGKFPQNTRDPNLAKKEWLSQEHTLYELTLCDKSKWYIDVGTTQFILSGKGNIDDVDSLRYKIIPEAKIPKDWVRTEKVGEPK